MSLSRPHAMVTIDGRRLSSAEAALVRVTVTLSLGGGHDPAELILWPTSKFAGSAPGSKMSIALGDAGAEEDVWAGEVTEVAAGADGVIVAGLAGTLALSRSRVSRGYLDQTVSDIATDLAGSVTIDQVAGDQSLSAYAVDDRRSVWAQLLDLGRLIGAEPSSSPSGGLRFVLPRTGTPDFKLRYGAEILSWSGGSGTAADVPGVVAYGAASQAGADQWHWILKNPGGGGAAGGSLRTLGALRTQDVADAMTQALTDRAARGAVHGTLRIVGRAGIRAGDLVQATGLPTGDPGTLRVRTVEHVLDSRVGFVTTLTVEGAG